MSASPVGREPARPDDDTRIANAWALVFGRAPVSAEVELAKSYLNAKDGGGPDRWERLTQVILGSNELFFVDRTAFPERGRPIPAIVEILGESLELYPQGVAYQRSRSTLYAADLHWGKEEAFRRAGVAVPVRTTPHDLRLLSQALDLTQARRLVVLGDLWHSREGFSEELFDTLLAWRRTHPDLKIDLIRGNHDAKFGPPPDFLGIDEYPDPTSEFPFVLQHIPRPSEEGYALAGHVHPSVVLRGRGRQSLRLSCFAVGKRAMLFPAFGGFTGTSIHKPDAGDRVFVIADDEVIEVGG